MLRYECGSWVVEVMTLPERCNTLLPPAIGQLSAVTFARFNSSISWDPSSHLCSSSLLL